MRGTPSIYFNSLNRHLNILGVDKQLFFFFVGITLPIAYSARLVPIMDFVALGIFIILHSIGVLITRADNQMLAIYRRHIYYKKFYRTSSGIHPKVLLVKPSVPFYQGKRGLI